MGEAWRIRGGAGQPDTRTTPSCQNTMGMGGKGQGSAAPSSHVWTSPAPPTSLPHLPWAPREPLVMSTRPTTAPAGTGLSQGLREGLGMPSALHFLVLLGGRGWNCSGAASCFQMHVRRKAPAAPAAVSLDPSSADCGEGHGGGGASLGLPCNSLHPHPGRVLAPAPHLDPVRRRSSHAVTCRLLNGCLVLPARTVHPHSWDSWPQHPLPKGTSHTHSYRNWKGLATPFAGKQSAKFKFKRERHCKTNLIEKPWQKGKRATIKPKCCMKLTSKNIALKKGLRERVQASRCFHGVGCGVSRLACSASEAHVTQRRGPTHHAHQAKV